MSSPSAEDLKLSPEEKVTVDALTEVIPRILVAFELLNADARVVALKTIFSQFIFGLDVDSEVSLAEMFTHYDRIQTLLDAVAFESLAECYEKDQAATLRALKRSSLRPEKIRDMQSALEAIKLSPQLRKDVQSDRLTVSNVADINTTANREKKDDLSRRQQLSLLHAGRKSILEHRETQPSRPMTSSHVKKTVKNAVRTSCPTSVKEASAKKPKTQFGLKASASGRTLTLTAPPHVIKEIKDKVNGCSQNYLALFSNEADADASTTSHVDYTVLGEAKVPQQPVHLTLPKDPKAAEQLLNQAAGFALVHAIVAGTKTLTSQEWDPQSFEPPQETTASKKKSTRATTPAQARPKKAANKENSAEPTARARTEFTQKRLRQMATDGSDRSRSRRRKKRGRRK